MSQQRAPGPPEKRVSPEEYGVDEAKRVWANLGEWLPAGIRPRADRVPTPLRTALFGDGAEHGRRLRAHWRNTGCARGTRNVEGLVQRCWVAFRDRWNLCVRHMHRVRADPAQLGREVARSRWADEPEARFPLPLTPEALSSLESSCEAALAEVGLAEAEDADALLSSAMDGCRAEWADLWLQQGLGPQAVAEQLSRELIASGRIVACTESGALTEQEAEALQPMVDALLADWLRAHPGRRVQVDRSHDFVRTRTIRIVEGA